MGLKQDARRKLSACCRSFPACFKCAARRAVLAQNTADRPQTFSARSPEHVGTYPRRLGRAQPRFFRAGRRIPGVRLETWERFRAGPKNFDFGRGAAAFGGNTADRPQTFAAGSPLGLVTRTRRPGHRTHPCVPPARDPSEVAVRSRPERCPLEMNSFSCHFPPPRWVNPGELRARLTGNSAATRVSTRPACLCGGGPPNLPAGTGHARGGGARAIVSPSHFWMLQGEFLLLTLSTPLGLPLL